VNKQGIVGGTRREKSKKKKESVLSKGEGPGEGYPRGQGGQEPKLGGGSYGNSRALLALEAVKFWLRWGGATALTLRETNWR